MTVKKSRDTNDIAILFGLEQASSGSRKKWLFLEEIMPRYRLAAEALRARCLHQLTVARRLDRLSDQGVVGVAQKPKMANSRGVKEERRVRAYRLAIHQRKGEFVLGTSS
jgi:hypothetical protein